MGISCKTHLDFEGEKQPQRCLALFFVFLVMAIKQKINISSLVVNRPFHFFGVGWSVQIQSWDFSRERLKTWNNKQMLLIYYFL